MTQRLRVGIIGLGRRWRRQYEPALRTLADRFEIAAVCDQIAQQASRESARLGCPALAGPSELIERSDIDAVLLLDLGWQRLWPIEPAATAAKPVLCLPSLEDDEPHADALARRVHQANVPVLMAVAAGFTPAALRLAEFRRDALGPTRLLVCESAGRKSSLPKSGLCAWLLSLLGAAPVQVTSAGSESAGLTSVTFQSADGRTLQLTHWHSPGATPNLRLHLIGERGQARLDGFRRLAWRDAGGSHVLTLPRDRPIAEMLLRHFYDVATRRQDPWPSLGDTHRALVVLRAAAQSRAEGRTVSL